MREISVKVYKFDELDDKAKDKAREWFREVSDEQTSAWEYIKEDAQEVGLRITQLDPHRANNGTFDKGAKDTAGRIIKNHGRDCETYKTALAFLTRWKELKTAMDKAEEESEEADKLGVAMDGLEVDFLDNILEDYRVMLEKEIEYQYSNEVVDENIRCNEYEFEEDGRRSRHA